MPELPEVETIARGLITRLSGRHIELIRVLNPRIIRGNATAFAECLQRKAVSSIHRHGKFLFIAFSDSDDPAVVSPHPSLFLKVHLGMTGQLLFEPGDKVPLKHTHVVFRFSGLTEELRYRDIRRFVRNPGIPNGVPF